MERRTASCTARRLCRANGVGDALSAVLVSVVCLRAAACRRESRRTRPDSRVLCATLGKEHTGRGIAGTRSLSEFLVGLIEKLSDERLGPRDRSEAGRRAAAVIARLGIGRVAVVVGANS